VSNETTTRFWRLPDGTVTSTTDVWVDVDPAHPAAVAPDEDDAPHRLLAVQGTPPEGAEEIDEAEHESVGPPAIADLPVDEKAAAKTAAAAEKARAALQKKLGLTDEEWAVLRS
jgi:hypothetical protein